MNELIALNRSESFKWIEGLALEELNMDESGQVNIHQHLNPVHALEEASIDFMNQIRDLIETAATHFNQYRGGYNQSSQIKIFKISNTVNDFMLFRHSLRLVFSRKSNDVISIGFLTSGGGMVSPRLSAHESMQLSTHEIKAHVGPFNDVTWRFQGEIVNLQSLVKFYLSEFIRNSAR
jgi:hypothetical protein